MFPRLQQHKKDPKGFIQNLNTRPNPQNLFQTFSRGSNRLWAEFEAFIKFYVENSPWQDRAIIGVAALLRRGRVFDVKWVNAYVSQVISSDATEQEDLRRLLAASRISTMSLDNFKAVVLSLQDYRAVLEKSERIKLERIIHQRMKFYIESKEEDDEYQMRD